jgi:UDP-N-acetylmuramoyl-tripeptide--D-alanyl-D-alanine ligase
MVQILIVLWLAGIILRVWRLARFFQIEGYETRRYLRWLIGKPQRYVMWRALVFAGVAGLISLALNWFGQDTEAVYLIVWGVAAVIGVWPEPTKEIKQKFKLTQRAARLLIMAFALAVIALIGTEVALDAAFQTAARTRFAIITGVGLVIYHLAALVLPLANVVLYPVEAGFRRMFVARARRHLSQAGPVVIGITGSYGKTSTKEYLAHILSARYRVLKVTIR